MARPEVLDRIKQAEDEADEIVDDARDDRDEILAEAREDADAIVEEARADADETEREHLEDARAEIEAERETILELGESERADLEARAAERTDAAVEEVLDRFREAVHAQT